MLPRYLYSYMPSFGGIPFLNEQDERVLRLMRMLFELRDPIALYKRQAMQHRLSFRMAAFSVIDFD